MESTGGQFSCKILNVQFASIIFFCFSLLEKKIKGLEKDLYFYKTKFRQGNRELNSQQQHSTDTSSVSNSGHNHGVHLPRLNHPGRLIDSEQRMTGLDAHQVEESKRLNVSNVDSLKGFAFFS